MTIMLSSSDLFPASASRARCIGFLETRLQKLYKESFGQGVVVCSRQIVEGCQLCSCSVGRISFHWLLTVSQVSSSPTEATAILSDVTRLLTQQVRDHGSSACMTLHAQFTALQKACRMSQQISLKYHKEPAQRRAVDRCTQLRHSTLIRTKTALLPFSCLPDMKPVKVSLATTPPRRNPKMTSFASQVFP